MALLQSLTVDFFTIRALVAIIKIDDTSAVLSFLFGYAIGLSG
jgi:hypothetical protein